jgi:ligand-binding sensor domain-containing protein
LNGSTEPYRFNHVTVDKNSTIWLGNDEGLFSFKDNRLVHYTVADGLIDNRIHALEVDEKGILWIGTELGLSSYDGESFTSHFTLYSNQIAAIVIDNNDVVWCSHLSEMRIDHLSFFKNGQWSIGPNGIYKLQLADNNNNLWGSSRGYLHVFDGTEINSYNIRNPLPGFHCDTTSSGYISDLHIDDNGIFWLASVNDTGSDCTRS